MVRDGLDQSSTKSWDAFNQAVHAVKPPASNDDSFFGFYFRDHEIIPRNVQGLFRFDSNLKMERQSLDIRSVEAVSWQQADARRILESQFLSFKSKINQLLPSDSPTLRRIYVAGGASANPVITSLLSSVLNAPIYASGSAQGCAMGGAYRAAWSFESHRNGDSRDFATFVKESQSDQDATITEGKVVAQPDPELVKVYNGLLEQWRAAEAEVIKACAS
jgi:xylulokinase